MPEPDTDVIRQRKLLEALVVGNPALERLEARLSNFNIFTVLGVVRQEVRHSNFLAYLLNPCQSHGLTTVFLKKFLQSALTGNTSSGYTPLDIEVWQPKDALVLREWRGIDLTVRDEATRTAVIIENKIDADEGPNQLQRYLEIAESEFRDWRIIALYLTPEGDRPSEDRYVAMSYSHVADVVERLAGSQLANDEVRLVLQRYAEMLRRYIVAESEISKLCQQIYEQHREALDLIFGHRPDQQDAIRQLMETLIKDRKDLEFDSSSKDCVRFWIKKLDASLLRQSTRASKRILFFEFYSGENEAWLNLLLGPGPKELREKLYEMATRKPPLKPLAKLGDKWNNIFSRQFLDSESYQKPPEERDDKIRKTWEQFLAHDLPKIVGAIEGETWIFEAQRGASQAATGSVP